MLVLRTEATRFVLPQFLVEQDVLFSHLLGPSEVARCRPLSPRDQLHVKLILYTLDLLWFNATVLVNSILKYRLVVALCKEELLLLFLEDLEVSLVVGVEEQTDLTNLTIEAILLDLQHSIVG